MVPHARTICDLVKQQSKGVFLIDKCKQIYLVDILQIQLLCGNKEQIQCLCTPGQEYKRYAPVEKLFIF